MYVIKKEWLVTLGVILAVTLAVFFIFNRPEQKYTTTLKPVNVTDNTLNTAKSLGEFRLMREKNRSYLIESLKEIGTNRKEAEVRILKILDFKEKENFLEETLKARYDTDVVAYLQDNQAVVILKKPEDDKIRLEVREFVAQNLSYPVNKVLVIFK
ncbi:SpoIIIAH-like family protein [Carboxydothermus pertinax]|uniref:Stage III sporulation protein AH n=1 Tax=Carboxydothermus pertinax TaxID=870242 RepID=A0A1L8CTZ2_9THEO|nr:SpoIIIAH-like family protein [Carboxydothermus pertinax]GAV22372.1 hypothetical protein cpu_08820 [Carboxydothermus pertinax]